jgi:hypothetical protein
MDFNAIAKPWLVPFAGRPAAEQVQYERAFVRLAKHQLKLEPGDVNVTMTVSYDSLPTVLGIMNLAVTLDDLVHIARPCAVPAPPRDDGGLPSLYELRFAWAGVVALHDFLVPQQNAAISKYLGAFNLLDVDSTDSVKVTELRHALCRLGTSPLSNAEFQHMLFRHRLLHRNTLTVFEFVRLLLDIPVVPIQQALAASAVRPRPPG